MQSPIDCLIKTVRQEGIAKGLYKGNSAMLLREIPGNFAWYGVYEGTCKALIPPGGTKKDLGTGVHLFGGALSGVTCVHTSCSPSQFQLNQHAQCSRSNTPRADPQVLDGFLPCRHHQVLHPDRPALHILFHLPGWSKYLQGARIFWTLQRMGKEPGQSEMQRGSGGRVLESQRAREPA